MLADRDGLFYLSIEEAGGLIRARQLSPVELTRAYLERIESLDGRLHCYLTLLPDSALAEARAAEGEIARDRYRGPMHGIPIALKDLFDTQGVSTTGQCLAFKDRVPAEDATVTARLKQAGAILLGKLSMWELAIGAPPSMGEETRNPWDLDRIPGGSSSGSGAAVAAGLCAGALGSDTGGSIRNPAALCGSVGLLPSLGRVSRSGIMPLSWSMDSGGPMTRTVEDTALMLQAISGHDSRDPTSSTLPVPDYRATLKEDLSDVVVGVPRSFYTRYPGGGVHPEVLEATERAIEHLEDIGAKLEEVEIPGLETIDLMMGAVVYLSEAFAYYQHLLRSQPEKVGESARRYLYAGALFSAADYVQAQRARSWLRSKMAEVFQRVHVLALPTQPGLADTFESLEPLFLAMGPKIKAIFNSIGAPAISVPCGFSESGLPLGLQIAGRPFDEETIMRVAYCYQNSTPYHKKRPPL